MLKKSMILGIVGAAIIFSVIGIPIPAIWAAAIQCLGPNACIGTPNDDSMTSDNFAKLIQGREGDDKIRASEGDDGIDAGSGNDVISGESGNDIMFGSSGADRADGGNGDDKIFQSIGIFEGQDPTAPDGSRDVIQCGAGNDEAWINVSVDHDIAANCETVHSG